MRQFAIFTGLVSIFALVLAGCGGGSSSTAISTITVTPTTLSMNTGDVAQLNPVAADAKGNAVSTTFTYTSSNPSVASVSTTGAVCAGTWDASFIVCTPAAASGSANITVAAGGVNSTAIPVNVHPQITDVKIDPVSICLSTQNAFQLVIHAFHNGVEVPTTPNQFTWSVIDSSIASVDSNTGVVTAKNPGNTGIFASISGISSVPIQFRTCMPRQITIHTQGSPSVTSATLAAGQSVTVEADMLDEAGVTSLAPVTILSTNPASVTVNGSTVTGVTAGGSEIFAVCEPPTCGVGFNQPIYSNPYSVSVTGTSPGTTVYATHSFSPQTPPATIIPIDSNAHTLGTPINLPAVPNSFVFAASGVRAYLGTTAGLVALDPTANTATVVDTVITGAVLAVSADGSKVVASSGALDPGLGTPIDPNPATQEVWIFDFNAKTVQTFFFPGVTSAVFDTDGFKAFMAGSDGNVHVFSPSIPIQTFSIGGSPTSVASLASDQFAFFANSSGLNVVTTCTNAVDASAPIAGSSTQLVQQVPNQDVMVAVGPNSAGSTGVNVETVTSVPPPSGIGCPPSVNESNSFIDFGVGPFTARQLLVATNGSHVLVLPKGINKVFSTALTGPANAPIQLAAGSTEPLTGGILPDGNTAWVGVAGTNTVDFLDLNANADFLQVAVNFKKADGTPAPPNLVAVRPK